MAVTAVKWVMSKRTILKHLFPVQNSGVHVQVCYVDVLHILRFGLQLNPSPK
ncbi:MRPL42 isoform 6 [Pan troglodytes]|uniref:Mitochondrial ribosomal protein L42 n=3 Tax=Pan TaxID=9596 RepID=A0A2I3S2Q1_PANTR|nr:MRPL42 isoform 6 [Pan troglodytes]